MDDNFKPFPHKDLQIGESFRIRPSGTLHFDIFTGNTIENKYALYEYDVHIQLFMILYTMKKNLRDQKFHRLSSKKVKNC